MFSHVKIKGKCRWLELWRFVIQQWQTALFCNDIHTSNTKKRTGKLNNSWNLGHFCPSMMSMCLCSVIGAINSVLNEWLWETIDYATDKLKWECNPLFYEGNRSNNVKHAQLRMTCSKLNAHLFSLHVSDTTQCSCGYHVEDTEHFLLHCPLYQASKKRMMQTIVRLNIYLIILMLMFVLLYGSKQNSLLTNKGIFSAVHAFILEYDRL